MLMLCQIALNINAQSISLANAIDTAIAHNQQLKNETLIVEYQKALTKAAFTVPQTSLSFDIGRINSRYYDNQVGLAQSFNFPTVYSKQKNVLQKNLELATINVQINQLELKKQVSLLFYHLNNLYKKQTLLLQSDSIYQTYLAKSNARLKQGETSNLENANANLQSGNIQQQLQLIKQDIVIGLIQFQLLLNSATKYIPDTNSIINTLPFIDSTVAKNHPMLLAYQKQIEIAQSNTQLEKSRLLPDINLGINSMTMFGNGSDNITYDYTTRFNAANIGIGIPLFYGAQKAKINAANIQEQIASNQFTTTQKILETQLNGLLKQIETAQNMIFYYENSALPNAQLILNTAEQQLINGEINYLDWTNLINQTISIKSAYLDAINLYNENVIQLHYLTQQ